MNVYLGSQLKNKDMKDGQSLKVFSKCPWLLNRITELKYSEDNLSLNMPFVIASLKKKTANTLGAAT